jgi:hypothetical protein
MSDDKKMPAWEKLVRRLIAERPTLPVAPTPPAAPTP